MSSNPINVGIIGFGTAGQVFHAPFLQCVEGFNVKTIRSSKTDHIEKAKALFPDVHITTQNNNILEDPEIDLVIVLTPNEFHFPLAMEALECGKHVVVDKPITIKSQRAKELIKIANAKGKVLSVYQNRRFDGDLHTIKRVIDSGKLGKLVEFELHYDRFRNFLKNNWREGTEPGSGILYDLGPHIIDQAFFLFGLPKRIQAQVKIQRSIASAIDYFDIDLFYEDPFKVTLKSGMLVKEVGPRWQIHGEQGSFVKYGIDPQEESLKAGLSPKNDPHWGKELPEFWGTLHYEEGERDVKERVETDAGDYRKYYENIRDVIQGTADLIVKPEQAYNNIRLIEMAIESSETERVIDCNF